MDIPKVIRWHFYPEWIHLISDKNAESVIRREFIMSADKGGGDPTVRLTIDSKENSYHHWHFNTQEDCDRFFEQFLMNIVKPQVKPFVPAMERK